MESFSFIEKMLQLCVFYILLQTATSAIDYGYEPDLDHEPEFSNYDLPSKQQRYDQILSNLHSLFKETVSDNSDSSKSTDDYNDFNYNVKDKQQFGQILAEVTSALDNIKEDLIKFNNDGLLTVEIPVVNEKRHKRDVSNNTEVNATTDEIENDDTEIDDTETDDTENDDTENDDTENNVPENNVTENNVTENNVTSTEIPETVTENVETSIVKNETSETNVLRANDTDITNVNTRRRMIPAEYVATSSSRVKNKLLTFIEDIFNEVQSKIKPLTNIKIALSNDNHYRIGYIIASIDTLEVNLKKLKEDVNMHHHYWDDEKILDLLDRMKATNTVTTSLIESLTRYLPTLK